MRVRTRRLPHRARRLPILVAAAVVAALGSAPTASGAAVEENPAVHCDQPGVDDQCEAWVFTYDNPNGHGTGFGWDIIDLRAMAVSPTGDRVYLTGTSAQGARPPDADCAQQHVVTVAVDQRSGEQVWEAHYGDIPFSYSGYPHAAVSPDGDRVFVLNTNRSQVCGKQTELKLVAYEAATGRQLWDATDLAAGGPIGIVGAGSLTVGNVVVSPDGARVYATARAYPRGLVLAFDAATGERLWTATSQDSESGRLVVSPDGGRVIYVDSEWDDKEKQLIQVVRAFDADTSVITGTPVLVWEAEESDPEDPVGVDDAVLSSDGSRIVVTGRIGRTAYATAVDTATGATMWTARYGGPTMGVDASRFRAVAVSPDGQRAYITGHTYVPQDGDESRPGPVYLTVAYDTQTGQRVWARQTAVSPWNDLAFAIAVSPDNEHVYVTGGSAQAFPYNAASGNGAQAATIAYDTTTGEQEWVAQFRPDNGITKGFTEGWDIGLSPDGTRVFVNALFKNDWTVALDTGLPGPNSTATGSCLQVNCADIGLLAYDTGIGAASAGGVGVAEATVGSSAGGAVTGVGR